MPCMVLVMFQTLDIWRSVWCVWCHVWCRSCMVRVVQHAAYGSGVVWCNEELYVEVETQDLVHFSLQSPRWAHKGIKQDQIACVCAPLSPHCTRAPMPHFLYSLVTAPECLCLTVCTPSSLHQSAFAPRFVHLVTAPKCLRLPVCTHGQDGPR